MEKLEPLSSLLRRLWSYLSWRKKIQFIALYLSMVVAALFEVLNIGAALPFLGILTTPEKYFGSGYMKPLIKFFNVTDPSGLLIPAAICFGLLAVLTNSLRLIVIFGVNRLTTSVAADLSVEAYRHTLYQPYLTHISRSSSEAISGISKITIAVNTILAILNLLSSMIMVVGILAAMIWVNIWVACSVFLGFGVLYGAVLFIVRSRVNENSKKVAVNSSMAVKSIQEGLGGIRDVILDGSQEIFGEGFRRADSSARRAEGNIQIISAAPRFMMEAIGTILILISACFLGLTSGGSQAVIPILGAIALGAQRLLPSLQLTYSSWINIKGGHASLAGALKLLDQPLPEFMCKKSDDYLLPFKKSIALRDVSFRYSRKSPEVINNLSLEIKKGSKVGFIGVTGGGKSTTLDLLMGLLLPTSGSLLVDNMVIDGHKIRLWQANISHVPQSIYLLDASIAENIAFGVAVEKIDYKRVAQSAQKANIANVIDGWPLKYGTQVGERGVKLSGGQRQRIGIARALYKSSQVIVFDEATSALDEATERNVMKEIMGLDDGLTVLVIAHRLTTLRDCDIIFEIRDGKAFKCESYEKIIELQSRINQNLLD